MRWLYLALALLCALVSRAVCDEGAAAAAGEGAAAASASDSAAADTSGAKTAPAAKGRKRTTKDWSKVKFDSLEKDWEKGDAEEELEHEYENSQRILKKKQSGGGGGGLAGIDINNPESIKKAMKKNPMAFSGLGQATQGASMVFVELQDTQQDGKPWDKESVDKLCGKWSALLKTAHLHANTFNLGDVEKKDSKRQVLVSIDKGWQAPEIFKFVMTQWETVKITKDSKDYFAEEYRQKLEDDDEL